MKIIISSIFLLVWLKNFGIQCNPITSNEQKVLPLDLNTDPVLLASMISKLKNTNLEKYIINDVDGNQKIDVRSLFRDPNSYPIMISFLKDNGYPPPKLLYLNQQLNSKLNKKDFFSSVGGFFTNMFGSVVSTFQQNIQVGFQNLLSDSIQQLLGQIQQTLFQGLPLDFNKIIEQFIENLKDSITSVIVSSVTDTFKQEAIRLLDIQLAELTKLLNSLKGNTIGPVQFIDSLQNILASINNSLKAFIPSISDIIGHQLRILLSQLINSIPIGPISVPPIQIG